MVVPNQDGVSDCRTLTDCRFLGVDKRACAPEPSLETLAMQYVNTLAGLKAAYDVQYAESQGTLREFVTCPEIALKKRFRIWADWCKKVDHPWIIHESDAGIFGKVVDKCLYDFDRYRIYTWGDMLDICLDGWNVQENLGLTENEIKEALIDTNFGSFYMDW